MASTSPAQSSHTRRLLLPTHTPPPPIPPRLLSRVLSRKSPPPKPVPQWIDWNEFALPRSSSSQAYAMSRNVEQTRAAGPPIPRRTPSFPYPTTPYRHDFEHAHPPVTFQTNYSPDLVNSRIMTRSYFHILDTSFPTSRTNSLDINRNREHMAYSLPKDEHTRTATQ